MATLGVEADEVQQAEGTHREAASPGHRGVDVVLGGDAGLQQAHGVVQIGNNSAFTTNPARSCTTTGVFPHATANAIAASIVSSLAVIGRTISTSDIIGAGLKKCTPHTWAGRRVSTASSTTGSVEVFVAMIVWWAHVRSSSVNRSFFVVRSSTTDSMTRSQSATSPRSDVGVMRGGRHSAPRP